MQKGITMATIREKASELLKQVPDEVRSNGDRPLFSRLTNGMTHENLMAEWERTKQTKTLRTVCIDFVGWYAQQMGIDIISSIDPKSRDKNLDGFFNLQKTLEKCGKRHAWVSAANGGRPQYGDILRHTAFHVDVALGFDGNILLRAAGGQSRHPRPTNDVSQEFDNVKRVRSTGPYDSRNLQGWLDIELFFEPPPVPIPAWVVGWWKVMWRGGIYYYHLGADRTARWTQMPPPPVTPPPLLPSAPRTGRLKFTNPYGITIRWTDSGSVEVFARKPNTVANEMTGTWNSSERIEATKL